MQARGRWIKPGIEYLARFQMFIQGVLIRTLMDQAAPLQIVKDMQFCHAAYFEGMSCLGVAQNGNGFDLGSTFNACLMNSRSARVVTLTFNGLPSTMSTG